VRDGDVATAKRNRFAACGIPHNQTDNAADPEGIASAARVAAMPRVDSEGIVSAVYISSNAGFQLIQVALLLKVVLPQVPEL
jgi:hypothetical protein